MRSDDVCRDVPVTLMAGSVSLEEPCAGDGPDATCAATASPDGVQGQVTIDGSGLS